MARRRHRGGGRTTPKGTRPHQPRAASPPSVAELLLRDAATSVDDFNELPLDELMPEYESFASETMSFFEPRGLPPRPVLSPRELLGAAKKARDAGAVMLAHAMAVYGPVDHRIEARRLCDDLSDRLGDDLVPEWIDYLGRVDIGSTWLLGDIWSDGGTIVVEYTDVTGVTAVAGCMVDPVEGGMATDFLAGAPLAALHELVDADEHATLTPLDPAVAAATFHEAMAVRGDTYLDDEDDEETDTGLMPLVAHRFGLLPEHGQPLFAYEPLSDERRAELTERFLARPGAAELDDAAAIADTICDFAGYCDGDPLRWSPKRVGVFVGGWIPAKVVADDEWYRNFPPVVREWLRFAADEAALRADGLEINLSEVDHAMGLMQENRHDAAMRSPTTNIVAEMQADGIDLLDKNAVDAWITAYNQRPRHERY